MRAASGTPPNTSAALKRRKVMEEESLTENGHQPAADCIALFTIGTKRRTQHCSTLSAQHAKRSQSRSFEGEHHDKTLQGNHADAVCRGAADRPAPLQPCKQRS